jgi:hypothetical protein
MREQILLAAVHQMVVTVYCALFNRQVPLEIIKRIEFTKDQFEIVAIKQVNWIRPVQRDDKGMRMA